MPAVPLLRPRDVVRAFESQTVRQRGSHIIMAKPGAVATVSVPNHSHGARGTLRTLVGKAVAIHAAASGSA